MNRPEDAEERISSLEDKVEVMDSSVKENVKSKSIQTQNIQEIQETMKRPTLQKYIERKTTKYLKQNYRRKLPQSKKGDTYKGTGSMRSTRQDQKRYSPWCTTIKRLNNQDKARIRTAASEKRASHL